MNNEKKYYRESDYLFQRGAVESNLLTTYGKTINYADYVVLSHTPFGEQISVSKKPIINLQSHHGLSNQRDYILEDGVYQNTTFSGTTSGRVLNENGMYKVSIDGADQQTQFESGQTGVYISGYWSEVGKGIMCPNDISEGVTVRWGYYNGTDGFGYLKDHTGLYIFVKSGGEETLIGQHPDQDNDTTENKYGWNVDKVDGSNSKHNASGVDLNLERGWMFQERFIHYGFGSIGFYINYINEAGQESKLLLHRYESESEILLENPNLPIAIHVESDETYQGGEFSIYVGGRQMSVIGDYVPLFRFSNMDRKRTITNNDWAPLISARMREGRKGIQTFVDGTTVSSDQDIKWAVFLNPILSDANFQAPINTSSNTQNTSETAVDFDISATTMSDGIMLYSDIIEGGKNKETIIQSIDSKLMPIPRDRIVTLAIQRKVTGSTEVFSMMRIRQEF